MLCRDREWEEDNQRWVQEVSSAPSTRLDVVHLQEQLDLRLQQRQARETGICPVRRELYTQCFGQCPNRRTRKASLPLTRSPTGWSSRICVPVSVPPSRRFNVASVPAGQGWLRRAGRAGRGFAAPAAALPTPLLPVHSSCVLCSSEGCDPDPRCQPFYTERFTLPCHS